VRFPCVYAAATTPVQQLGVFFTIEAEALVRGIYAITDRCRTKR
jgi:hypothetical protein